MEVIDGVEYYADIFDRHVKKGDELIVDKALAERSYFVFTRQKKNYIIQYLQVDWSQMLLFM